MAILIGVKNGTLDKLTKEMPTLETKQEETESQTDEKVTESVNSAENNTEDSTQNSTGSRYLYH